MAAPVYTQRLLVVNGVVPAAGALPSPTCPAGYRWILRDMVVIVDTTPTQAIVDIITGPSVPVRVLNWSSENNPSDPWQFHWSGRQVMNPGDYLTVACVMGGFDFASTVYQLSLP